MPRKLGQHFLQDEKIAEQFVSYADISEGESVLEIGPGHGILTKEICEKTSNLIVVEKDRQLAQELKQRFPQLKVVTGDILRIQFPKADKIISNLPFQISAPLMFLLLKKQWKLAVLSFQKEFAEKFFAQPGEKKYSRLSIAMQYYCEAEKLGEISASKFYPKPLVETWILRIRKRVPPFETDARFWELVNKLFQHKRKIVRASLKVSKFPREKIALLPEELARKRVDRLTLEDVRKLYHNLY